MVDVLRETNITFGVHLGYIYHYAWVRKFCDMRFLLQTYPGSDNITDYALTYVRSL